jgi:hypothetical protein
MQPKVYLETTIPSYLSARPTRDLIRAAHQKVTKDWWTQRRKDFDLYVSQFVIDEIAGGDSIAAQKRLDLIRGLPMLAAGSDVSELAAALVKSLQLPARAVIDAAHISVAAVHNMHFLLTWNCTHIGNAELLDVIRGTCGAFGVACPVICTPEELMGTSF